MSLKYAGDALDPPLEQFLIKLSLSLSLSLTHTHTHTRARALSQAKKSSTAALGEIPYRIIEYNVVEGGGERGARRRRGEGCEEEEEELCTQAKGILYLYG